MIKKWILILFLILLLNNCGLMNKYKENKITKLYVSVTQILAQQIELKTKQAQLLFEMNKNLEKLERQYKRIYPKKKFVYEELDLEQIKKDFPEKFVAIEKLVTQIKEAGETVKRLREKDLELEEEKIKQILKMDKLDPEFKYHDKIEI
ncbi:MAG: hypothetical protein MJB14_11700 [Spirochaetes bacterium]|nr:hypothetical protein [Spirochaetota bacterium]